MICTNCFIDTGDEPDFSNMMLTKSGAMAVVDLCAHWMCRDCLDQWEYEQSLKAAEAPMTQGEEKGR